MLKKILGLILTSMLLFTAAISLASCDDNDTNSDDTGDMGDTGDVGDTGGSNTNPEATDKPIHNIKVIDDMGNAVKGVVIKVVPPQGAPFERTTNGEGKIVAATENGSKAVLVSVPEGYFATDGQLGKELNFTDRVLTITVATPTYVFTIKDSDDRIYAGATLLLYADTGEPVATATTNDKGVAFAYIPQGASVYRTICKLSDAGNFYVEESYTSANAKEYELLVLAPSVSENPIVSASVHEGEIKLTYKDNSELSLGNAPRREGYNDITSSYEFSKTTNIVTVSLIDSSSSNIANELISAPQMKLTLRLRENDGKLEWASATEEDWQILCDSNSTDESPIQLLAILTEFGKHKEITSDRVVLAINGNSLRFRAREWKNGVDFVMDASLDGSNNKSFNISTLAELNSSASLDSMSATSAVGYKPFKNSGDDITPIHMNGTYIGANHGYYVVASIPNDAGLTEEDIGSIWQVDSMQYVLVKITSTSVWFCPYYESAMTSGSFSYQKIRSGKTVTHISGATHTDSFTASKDSTQQQFFLAINHLHNSAFLNGTNEIDLTKNGYYTAEFIDFYEEYDVIYLPAMLQHLIDNVGYNNNDTHHDDSLVESYVTFRNTYRFHKNGACVVYSSYEFHKDVSIGYIGGVQSIKFDESTHYAYVPGTTNLSTPTLQEGESLYVNNEDLSDPDTLVTSYFQLSDENGTKAMNLGFNPLYGTGVNDVRDDYFTNSHLGYYYTSYKLYPRLIGTSKLAAGTKITCVAYRLPSYILDDDFTAINWYWVGDDIYLSLHTDKSVDKTVTVLPEYMNGMEITVIEGSDSFTVNSDTIENGSISVTSSGAGYTILKLADPTSDRS